MLSRLIGFLKSEGGAYLGLIGGVLTVYSGFQDVITLASWAQALVEHFLAATTWVWSQLLAWLPRPIRPIDATFLNLSVFTTFFALSYLRRGHRAARKLAEVQWTAEALAAVGMVIAGGIIFAAGFAGASTTFASETYGALLDRVAAAPPGPARDAASWDFISIVSGFLEPIDTMMQGLGYGVDTPFLERIETVVWFWVILMVILIVLPVILIDVIGRVLGYERDTHLAVRNAWRFNLACLLVFALNYVATLHTGLCSDPNKAGAAAAICNLL